MDIVIATTNEHKVHEYQQMVKGLNINFLSLNDINFKDEIIEDGKTFKENSLIKAQAIANKTSLDVLSDDSGIIIEDLGENVPGIYSHRYAIENGGQAKLNEKLVNEVPNSKAYFVCVITYIHEGKVKQFEGFFHGTIATKVEGINGFGYDPIFIPQGFTRAISTFDEQKKNEISHRSLAFKQFINYLKENNLLTITSL